MRVLMLGWEFPPFISGGLGTACYGLTKAMSSIGTDIMFVLPRAIATRFSTHVRLLSPSSAFGSEFHLDDFQHVTFRPVDVQLANPYQSADSYAGSRPGAAKRKAASSSDPATESPADPSSLIADIIAASQCADSPYAGDLFSEIRRYARLAGAIARHESFDVVHAHDWMTFPAGIAVARLKGVPLIAHVHSTEFDRSGLCVDQRIYDIERSGVREAARVIAVSGYTKEILTHHYGADPGKIQVVYNGIEPANNGAMDSPQLKRSEQMVLFLGRITMQKGPEYFLAAAKKVLELMDNVKFIMAGSGDMMRRTIEMAAAMGIGHKVLFTGFLRGHDVDRIFKMADLYVMPSVSEPFGIAPLEAMSHDVPVIISKQSGVCEVLTHALKVDFWDINEMANKIVAVLRHAPLAGTLRHGGHSEVHRLNWTDAARACLNVYQGAAAH
jgi:glycosyltransferase involved in cell wall biosynthesis